MHDDVGAPIRYASIIDSDPLDRTEQCCGVFLSAIFQEYASWTCWQTHTFAPKPSFPRMPYCWWPPAGDQSFGIQSLASPVEARAKGFPNGR